MDAGPAESKTLVESEGHQNIYHHKQQQHHGHHHYYNHQFFRQASRFGLLLGVIVVTCFVLNHSAYPFQILPHSSYGPVQDSYADKGVDSNLKGILEKAAMPGKTVIITTLNGAWAAPNSIFDLFLESFRLGNETGWLLNHLVVIALDHKAYDRCLALLLHPHCYVLSTNGTDFSAEAYFMTNDYLEMMWRRIDFLHSVLKLGYNFIFTDTDIMWFRDPFLHLLLDGDFQIACDYFWGNPSDLNNLPNGGFNYVKSNDRTIRFYEFWYTSRETYPGLHDQDVLNKIKFDPFLRKLGLKMKFLDTAYFGGFCQPSKDLNRVCTMHANCCLGLDNKVHDLKVMLQDWKNFLSLPTDVRASQPTSWTVPQNCSNSFRRPSDSSKKKVQQGSIN